MPPEPPLPLPPMPPAPPLPLPLLATLLPLAATPEPLAVEVACDALGLPAPFEPGPVDGSTPSSEPIAASRSGP